MGQWIIFKLILQHILLARSLPFRVRVNFDSDEFRTNTDASIDDTDAATGEYQTRPAGIIGIHTWFNLTWK